MVSQIYLNCNLYLQNWWKNCIFYNFKRTGYIWNTVWHSKLIPMSRLLLKLLSFFICEIPKWDKSRMTWFISECIYNMNTKRFHLFYTNEKGLSDSESIVLITNNSFLMLTRWLKWRLKIVISIMLVFMIDVMHICIHEWWGN